MALEPQTARLGARLRGRVDVRLFDAYLSELRVLELADGRVVIAVGATLEREVARRFGGTLVSACGDLFRVSRVVLAGESEGWTSQPWFSSQTLHANGSQAAGARRRRPVRRLRQRAGPAGQPGIAQRLEAQQSFRVPFAIAASLPRTATKAFGRHSANEPLEYVGRWGRARSQTSLTAFHHRLLLGTLRLAQAGCLTDQGTASSVNLLLLAAEGKGSRELPVARDQVLPALMDLLVSRATHTAHHRAEHTGQPYIADRRGSTGRSSSRCWCAAPPTPAGWCRCPSS
jgi:hypothetical protein